MEDKELIKQVLNGNAEAFKLLVIRYQKLVVHITSKIIDRKEEVEDICQDVFIKVYQNLGKYRSESKLSTWIATIAYNTSINNIRKYQKVNELSIEESNATSVLSKSITNDYEKQDLYKYIREQIDLLPVNYRSVITLYHLNEFSYAEIEQITGMPEGTVKSYLYRAKALLKEKLKHIVDENSLEKLYKIGN